MGLYEAPVHNRDSIDRVPQSYIVFPPSGCSLDQHKQAIGDGVDLESAIKYVFPETASHGLYNSVELDNASLAAVRADTAVGIDECNLRVHFQSAV